MPITKQQGYLDSAGVMHASVEAAQQAEMEQLLRSFFKEGAVERIDLLAADIITSKDAILAILTTGPRTRVKARKTPATSNPRRAAKRLTDDEARARFKAMREAGPAPALTPDPQPA